ncbi:GNAT family N-acetyltransferase [Streptococcus merionis]|uniref:GNAT family N-acetyltransferase n=1 Tax=Streptococcus merionis TaxID=400065 RepID=UPI0026EAB98A|nr:GNAT family N-acetyltransferase [Streptococcus merionis]
MWEQLAKWARFETNRLILRPFVYQDGKDFFDIMSDEDNTTFLHPAIDCLELCRQLMVEGFMRQPLGIWAIEERNCGRMIGSIRLENIKAKSGQAEIGYFLHREFWQQGLGTEALEGLVFLAFNQLGLRQLFIKTHVENKASQALAQKLGFQLLRQYKGSDRHSHRVRTFNDYVLNKTDYDLIKKKEE